MHHTVSDKNDYELYFAQRSGGNSLSELDSHIYYEFLIEPDGTIQQHRTLTEGSRATRNNNQSVNIAMVGDFTHKRPSKEQLISSRKIIQDVRGLFGDLKVYEHGELEGESTQCAGNKFDTGMLSQEYIDNYDTPAPAPAPVVAEQGSYLGNWKVTTYYAPVKGQAKYYNGSYAADYKVNCSGSCFTPKLSQYTYTAADAYTYVACPSIYLGKKFTIKTGSQTFHTTCVDIGGAIQGRRLDLRVGVGDTGRSRITTYYGDIYMSN